MSSRFSTKYRFEVRHPGNRGGERCVRDRRLPLPRPDATLTSVDGDTRVVPQLSVRRGRAAIDFYKRAFGAVEDYRVGGTDEHEAVVAQLSVEGAPFWVSDESPEHLHHSPETLSGSTTRVLLQVADPAAMAARAVAAGATEIYPVSDEHGWRLGRVQDPFGHQWEIGCPLGPWPPPGG